LVRSASLPYVTVRHPVQVPFPPSGLTTVRSYEPGAVPEGTVTVVPNEVDVTEVGAEKVAPGAVLDTTRPLWKSVPPTVIGVLWP
jgi:hypothetical protein